MSSFLASLTIEHLKPLLQKSAQVEVIYGPEGFLRDIESGPFIQVIHDPAGDTYEQPTGTRPGRYVKWNGVVARFKGSSSKPGATPDDHEEVVEALVDLFIVYLENTSHRYGQQIRNLRGAPSLPEGVDADSSQSVFFYDLTFQYGRGIIEAKAKQTAQGLVSSNTLIVTDRNARELASGAAAAIIGSNPGSSMSVGGLEGVTSDMQGLTIALSGAASAGNDGTFRILSVLDATSVIAENANAVVPDANNGSIAWVITRSEIAVPGA